MPITVPGFANRSKQAALPITFVIVGGGIAGLSTAIALRRVGHHAIVLEQNADTTQPPGVCRMSPNLSKILYQWGLKRECHSIGAVSGTLSIHLMETGECLGKHTWDEEVLRETRGEFVFVEASQFRQLLLRTALAVGAEVRFNSKVTAVDTKLATATLNDGTIIRGDVILGCDGLEGVTRNILLEENEEDEGKPTINHISMYSATVPMSAITSDPLLSKMHEGDADTTRLFNWFGNQHAGHGIPTGGSTPIFGMFVYSPRERSNLDFATVLERFGPRLRRLGQLAIPELTTCTHVEGRPPVEEWIANSMLVMGSAVHAMPPGAIQDAAMTVEDGAVLAKIFSHLRSRDQIQSFLYAFQDVRQPRTSMVRENEINIIHYTSAPPGELQQLRDETMRAKTAAGKNVLEAAGDMEESPEWAEVKEVFGYDAEDEADNWWVQWGLLREHAKERATDNCYISDVVVSQAVSY